MALATAGILAAAAYLVKNRKARLIDKVAEDYARAREQGVFDHPDYHQMETPEVLIKRCAVETLEAYNSGVTPCADAGRLLCGKMLLRAYESSNTILLAFSGTACWKDMHMNSLFWQSEPLGRHHDEVDSHGHSAHTGFQTEWAQYRALLADKSTDCGHQFNLLLGYLGERRMSKAQPTVVCCGHSLGGALAVLCAQWISADYCPWARVFCVTFGAPRVGNDQFVNKYHESLPVTCHFRVQNHGDPVPKMPSHGNYLHVGQEVANCGGCPCLVHGPEEPKDVHRFQCVHDLSLVNGLHKHGMLAYVTWLNHIDTNCVELGKDLDGGDIAFGDLLQ